MTGKYFTNKDYQFAFMGRHIKINLFIPIPGVWLTPETGRLILWRSSAKLNYWTISRFTDEKLPERI